MNKNFRWVYKIINKDNEFKEDEWITALSASEICKWFETIGYEVIYLNRVCQATAVQKGEVLLNNRMTAKIIKYE